MSVSPMVGLSHKFVKTSDDKARSLSRVMPTYGLYDNNQVMKSTRNEMEASREDLDLELQGHDKIFFKQKFFMKMFMDEMIKANVNPNHR